MLAAQRARWQRWLNRRIPPAREVRLDQRRIFIIPTRQGLGFLLLIALLLIGAINYQNNLAYFLAFWLLSLFLVAILNTYRSLSGLVLRHLPSVPVFVGEQACLPLELIAERRSYQALALGWPPAQLSGADVEQGGNTRVELFLPAAKRGWLKPGRLRVESRFPLGLFVAWSWVDLDQQVLVYPAPMAGAIPLADHGAQDDDEGVRIIPAGVDDYQGLRTYQPGDNKRRLHWKAYSRGQGLLVKEFAGLAGRDVWLDFASASGGVEQRLSRLTHAVLTLHQQGHAFGMRLPGVELAPSDSASHRDACLRALALYGLPT
ncbi:DUF58 domain-containing protein [Atopomonas sediminilitoris]|uniref:DUF58 domain-containing protein n=1 Tax=Atopomonas sediminilitoris TaxID=2919919 RepID=UPI001F4E9E97|nr:DUF58 domain-containing protein [Atopomonas sediminilitoris]MCJ8169228.1 DUF58 domain-containing protein [Atopomonas sediminilitoris]